MSTIPTNMPALRRIAGEFIKALKENDWEPEQLENGLKTVNLAYLGFESDHSNPAMRAYEEHEAPIIWQMCSSAYVKYVTQKGWQASTLLGA